MTRGHGHRLRGRYHFSLTEVDQHAAHVALRAGADAIAAGLAQEHRTGGGSDLYGFTRCEIAHAHVDCTLSEPQLRRLVIEIEHVDAGQLGETDGHGTDVQLGASGLVRPQTVTGGKRPIQHGLGPGTRRFRGGERHCAGYMVETRHATRRVRIRGCAEGHQQQGQNDTEYAEHKGLSLRQARVPSVGRAIAHAAENYNRLHIER